MAFLGKEYSADSLPVNEKTGFDPVPAGWYSATISGAEVKDTKKGNGKYINVTYSITGPTHQGRLIFGMINIENANEKAEQIGLQQFGELLRSIGKAKVKDSDELIGSHLQIKVSVKPADGEYSAKNDVKGFRSDVGSQIPTAIPQSAQSQPKPQASAATPPWVRK